MPKATTTRKTTTTRKATKSTGATRGRSKAAVVADATAAVQDSGGDFNGFLTDLKALCDRYLDGAGSSPAVAVDEEPDEPQTREDREAEISKWTLRQLKAALIAAKDEDGDAAFDEEEINSVTAADKDLLVENLLDFEFGESESDEPDEEDDEDEDEEPDEEDEDEDEEGDEDEITREDILALSLAEARKLAVSTYGIDASDVKGKDKDTIADLILEAAGAEEEDEEDEGDEEDGEDGEEFYSEEELDAMPIREVRGICDENDISYTVAEGKNKAKLIAKIMAA